MSTERTFIIDCDKWICGGDSIRHLHQCGLGNGITEMLNDCGYMCCLGQVSKQLYPNINLDGGDPEDVYRSNFENDRYFIDILCYYDEKYDRYANTELSVAAMSINDEKKTSVKTKISKLTDLFAGHGYDLNFINVPDWADDE